jgi:hypothetical protein
VVAQRLTRVFAVVFIVAAATAASTHALVLRRPPLSEFAIAALLDVWVIGVWLGATVTLTERRSDWDNGRKLMMMALPPLGLIVWAWSSPMRTFWSVVATTLLAAAMFVGAYLAFARLAASGI